MPSGEESWETLADVTIEEDSVPIIDLGDVCANFRKMRFFVVLAAMTPSAIRWVVSNSQSTLGGATYVIYEGSVGNSSNVYQLFIEFEPLLTSNACRRSVVGAAIPGTSSAINNFSYVFNSYDTQRLKADRYLYTNAELPAGTTVTVTAVRK